KRRGRSTIECRPSFPGSGIAPRRRVPPDGGEYFLWTVLVAVNAKLPWTPGASSTSTSEQRQALEGAPERFLCRQSQPALEHPGVDLAEVEGPPHVAVLRVQVQEAR